MSYEVEWRVIPGVAGGRFEVSDDGRVRNARSKRVRRTSRRSGYVRVTIENKAYSAHRLVAMAFLPGDQGRPFVNHKNGDRGDNRVENLEWCTHGENMRHAVEAGLLLPQYGRQNPAAKLCSVAVRVIRGGYACGVTQAKLAAMHGVTQSLVSKIIRREIWDHVR